MALSREQIFGIKDAKVERVEVPEWGDCVHVRTLSARERDSFEASTIKVKKDGSTTRDLANLRGRLAALVICDERGVPLFSEDDAGQLGDRSVCAIERILKVARKLNGLDEEAVEEAKGN